MLNDFFGIGISGIFVLPLRSIAVVLLGAHSRREPGPLGGGLTSAAVPPASVSVPLKRITVARTH